MVRLYDGIGEAYRDYRRADPRIAHALTAALGDAASVVNVGAGAGSYEPFDRRVVAVEPSPAMIAARPHSAAPSLRAVAEALPFADRSFDACLAILTIHHWSDWRAGIREMKRVARGRIVIFTWDPDQPPFWLVKDYFPDIHRVDNAIFPGIHELVTELGPSDIAPVPVPADCSDGFLGAYWQRPHRYLEDGVRGAISTFRRIARVADGVDRLRADLASGAWESRYAELRDRAALDVGYRLITHVM